MLYKCKKCENEIDGNTNDKFIYCSCRSIGIIGTAFSTRIVRGSSFIKMIDESEETYTYRIKQVSTGLYYRPLTYKMKRYSNIPFSKNGKFYSYPPSLKWVNSKYRDDCQIEKYKIKNMCII